ncbi:hypothetical protein GQS52_02225 [Streptomyces sp. SCUT-3]|uniref:hypothetical protein n=1 Tax=Streptomyces sp. SCUT-3 TaxID=2684469 RepID=UPI000CB68629|nr:hypothetical protein [Streptomyces sp. SCUT-3]PLW66317.1 hypothetical protein C0036_23440 [Streptomyces sp. DJ]QMV20800.1 hypothetical protein GQS52_02225 [Streptomyces sp. SCUT-3]
MTWLSSPNRRAHTATLHIAHASLASEGIVTADDTLTSTTETEDFLRLHNGILGPELMDKMRSQAEHFSAEPVSGDVLAVDLTGETKNATYSTDAIHRDEAVIVAAPTSPPSWTPDAASLPSSTASDR